MFIQNKYSQWYYAIITNAQQQKRKKLKRNNPNYIPYDKHHIVPECFFINRSRKGQPGWIEGNPEEQTNKVVLTPREHFICHWLLTKMTKGQGKALMVYALNGFKRSNNSVPYETKITSRVYENLKKEFSRIHSERLTGKKQSIESNIKRSMAMKGKLFSEEHRTNISTALTGKIRSEIHCANLSAALKGKKLGPQSIEHKTARANALRGVPKAQITCPHCNKTGGISPMTRWHFDNCKQKDQLITSEF
ncbi:MAG TPA: hypothetical protein VFM18_18425 [Methanosarcina sp.]|nr:hypothetical protein [Methanosarcina sp.]